MPSKAQTIIHLHRTRPDLTPEEIAAACRTTKTHMNRILREYHSARVRLRARWTGVPGPAAIPEPTPETR